MKYLIGVPIVIVILIILAVYSGPKTEVRVIYPEYKSVVILDDRSHCEKKSELVLLFYWERTCTAQGKDRDCSLSKSEADQAYLYKQFSLDDCQKLGS